MSSSPVSLKRKLANLQQSSTPPSRERRPSDSPLLNRITSHGTPTEEKTAQISSAHIQFSTSSQMGKPHQIPPSMLPDQLLFEDETHSNESTPSPPVSPKKTIAVARRTLSPASSSSRSRINNQDTSDSSEYKKKICPPTPLRLQKNNRTIEAPAIQEGVPFTLERWGTKQPLRLTPVKILGSGMHGTAWLVHMDDGTERVYKVDERPNFSYVKEELYQYAQLRELGFPVAIYDDLEEIIQDPYLKKIMAIENKVQRDRVLLEYVRKHVNHGYHLREYVPHPFPSYPSASIESPLYDQLKAMMSKAYKARIAVDLQKANVGYKILLSRNNDGKMEQIPIVLLFDLMPHDEMDEDRFGNARKEINPFGVIIKQCLKTFAPKGTPIYKKIDPRVS